MEKNYILCTSIPPDLYSFYESPHRIDFIQKPAILFICRFALAQKTENKYYPSKRQKRTTNDIIEEKNWECLSLF